MKDAPLSFEDCCNYCLTVRALVGQYDRLIGGSIIDALNNPKKRIKASAKWCAFVYEIVWSRIDFKESA